MNVARSGTRNGDKYNQLTSELQKKQPTVREKVGVSLVMQKMIFCVKKSERLVIR